jgi:molybdenum cofactor biosynthesis enzyme MoaA
MNENEVERTQECYATNKLAAHPEILRDMRQGGDGNLITVHLMPCNVCNMRCSFCAFRLPDNKNSVTFNEQGLMPVNAMLWLLEHLEEMGVEGIEVTGGGEPLIYPYTQRLWEELATRNFATALVTNGVAIKDRAPLLTERMKWARVSIDCATSKTYSHMRQCSENQFDMAWRAVRELRDHAPKDPDFRLGVGFVLSNENTDEVYEFVKIARDSGADNVRLSSVFSDKQIDYYKDKAAVDRAVADSVQAQADFDCPDFRVHNLIPTRVWEIQHPRQDYGRCPTKDLLCVVEGECKVFTCCTFTGSLYCCYGKFTDYPNGFKGLWDAWAWWRREFVASEYCKTACLYRDRNLAMNSLIEASDEPPSQEHVHKEFI